MSMTRQITATCNFMVTRSTITNVYLDSTITLQVAVTRYSFVMVFHVYLLCLEIYVVCVPLYLTCTYDVFALLIVVAKSVIRSLTKAR